MMRRGVLVVGIAAVVALAWVPAAEAASCSPVTAGDFRATGIKASNIGCGSVRSKLGRWFRRGGLPRDQFGWYCTRTSRSGRLCSGGNGGGAPYFRFKVHRRGSSARVSSKYCGKTYGGDVITATNRLNCSKARAIVRAWAVGYRRSGQASRIAFGYRCRGGNDRYEGLTIRCRRGRKVVRFYANVQR